MNSQDPVSESGSDVAARDGIADANFSKDHDLLARRDHVFDPLRHGLLLGFVESHPDFGQSRQKFRVIGL